MTFIQDMINNKIESLTFRCIQQDDLQSISTIYTNIIIGHVIILVLHSPISAEIIRDR